MKAIILAGGEGTRLRPITSHMPKPLVPVMGVPLLARIIMLLKEHGITEIGIASCYMEDKIEQAIADGSTWGVHVTYFHEKTPLGTAGAVKQAETFLSDTFVVIAGDCLTDVNLTEAIDFHREKSSMATLVLKRVDIPLKYGVVITDASGRVTRFLEKPSWNEVFSDTVNTGIYILDKAVLAQMETNKPVDFSKDLFPGLLAENKPMYGYEMQGYWCDVGDVDVYRKSHFDLFDRRLAMREAFDAVTIEEGAMIEEGAQIIPPVRIGRGTRIEAGAKVGKYAVVGRGCFIRRGASVSRSVLMDGVLLEKGASVRGSILCDRVIIKQDAMVFEQTVIGEHSQVGRGSVVCPGVRVFSYKEIPEGINQAEHLIWGANQNPLSLKSGVICGTWGYELSTTLAEHFGTSIGGEGRGLAVACSEEAASESLLQAFTAGAVGSGATVYHLGNGTAPLVSNAIRAKHLFGGVWFGVQDDCAQMVFMEKNGAVFSGKDTKKLQIKEKGDTTPVASGKVGRPMDCAAYRREYVEGLLAACRMKDAHVSFSLRGGNETVLSYAKATLSRMGCHVSEGTAVGDRETTAAFLSADGRELLLYDEAGIPVFGERLRALYYLLLTKHKEQAKVWLTQRIPTRVAEFVEKTGVQKNMLEESNLEEALCTLRDVDAYRQRMVFYDAVGALCMLAQIMTEQKKNLSVLLEELPSFFVVTEELPCAENKKAAMLTYLKAAFDEKEAVGGICVTHAHGKAYLYPDAQREVFHMATEGTREEYARELAELCKTVFRKFN